MCLGWAREGLERCQGVRRVWQTAAISDLLMKAFLSVLFSAASEAIFTATSEARPPAIRGFQVRTWHGQRSYPEFQNRTCHG